MLESASERGQKLVFESQSHHTINSVVVSFVGLSYFEHRQFVGFSTGQMLAYFVTKLKTVTKKSRD